jgi:hypothetical protein
MRSTLTTHCCNHMKWLLSDRNNTTEGSWCSSYKHDVGTPNTTRSSLLCPFRNRSVSCVQLYTVSRSSLLQRSTNAPTEPSVMPLQKLTSNSRNVSPQYLVNACSVAGPTLYSELILRASNTPFSANGTSDASVTLQQCATDSRCSDRHPSRPSSSASSPASLTPVQSSRISSCKPPLLLPLLLPLLPLLLRAAASAASALSSTFLQKERLRLRRFLALLAADRTCASTYRKAAAAAAAAAAAR